MALPRGIVRLLSGMPVKTTEKISWHELNIPAGSKGVIKYVTPKGDAIGVQFDNKRYGSFECWAYELTPA